jgi:hypothetical protein
VEGFANFDAHAKNTFNCGRRGDSWRDGLSISTPDAGVVFRSWSENFLGHLLMNHDASSGVANLINILEGCWTFQKPLEVFDSGLFAPPCSCSLTPSSKGHEAVDMPLSDL